MGVNDMENNGFKKYHRAIPSAGTFRAEFPKRLSELLGKRKMTQKQFAEEAGLTESTVSNYLSGKRYPDGVSLCSCATVLGVSVEYLTGVSGSESTDRNLLELVASFTDSQKELASAILKIIPLVVKE